MSDEEDDQSGDPFEQLEDDVGEREGDPFANLSDGVEDEGDETETPPDETAETTGSDGDWVDEFGVDGPTVRRETASSSGDTDIGGETSHDEHTADADTGSTPEDDTEPGVDTDAGPRVQSETDSSTDPFSDMGHRDDDPFEQGDLFEERDTEGVDPDTVWENLASSDETEHDPTDTERRFAEVSKHSYCEQCEHFSPPPDISCTHEGTDIVEFLDMETVRLVNCPIVAERLELENES
jgi:hypothetical protein